MHRLPLQPRLQVDVIGIHADADEAGLFLIEELDAKFIAA